MVGLIIAASIFYLFKFADFYRSIYTPKDIFRSPINNTQPKEKNTFSIVLLGYAGSNHQGTYLTDTVIVLTFDVKKKSALLISLPRDIWVKLPTKSGDDFRAKINTVYETELFPNDFPDLNTKIAGSKSDAELTKHVIGEITGLTIDNYVSIDFESFTRAIDVVGGVDIEVAKTFEDAKYPVEGKENDTCEKKDKELEEALKIATQEPEIAFPCRYEKISFAAGQQHMDGKTALKFVRSRQSPQDGGDFARARRQQQLLEAVRNKILSVDFVIKIPALLDQMKNYVKTDVSPSEIQNYLKQTPNIGEYKLTSIVLSDQNVLKSDRSDNGQFILIPKEGKNTWGAVKEFIKNSIEGITPTPAPSRSLSPPKKS